MKCKLYDRYGALISKTNNPEDVKDHVRRNSGSIVRYDEDGEERDGVVNYADDSHVYLMDEDHTPVPYDRIRSVEP